MTDILFDAPWWFLALVAGAGIGLLLAGNRRQDKQLTLGGMIGLATALVLFLLSYFIETPREKAMKRSTQVVEAFEKKDKTAVGNLLHPRANLRVGEISFTKDWLLDKSATAVDEYRLKNLRVTSMEAVKSGDDIVVTMNVTTSVEISAMTGDAPSTWQLTWVKSGDQYLLRDIRCLKLPFGMDLSTITSRLK